MEVDRDEPVQGMGDEEQDDEPDEVPQHCPDPLSVGQ
jgi:hypothetical protein